MPQFINHNIFNFCSKVSVIALITGVSTFATSAQATLLSSGELDWTGATDPFVAEVGNATFDVNFTNGIIINTSPGFDFIIPAPLDPAQFPITLDLQLISSTIDPFGPDLYLYESTAPITFDLGIDENGLAVQYVLDTGTFFDVKHNGITSAELTMSPGNSSKGFFLVDGMVNSAESNFQFSATSNVNNNGTYTVNTQIVNDQITTTPEPASLLGLLTIGGMVLGVKSGKQVRKS